MQVGGGGGIFNIYLNHSNNLWEVVSDYYLL